MAKPVIVVGGGPIGCMLAIFLASEDHQVKIYEGRKDIRESPPDGNRNINLLINEKGLVALKEVGCDVGEFTRPINQKLYHDGDRVIRKKEVKLWTAQRQTLTETLLNTAEKLENITIFFEHKLEKADLKNQVFTFKHCDKLVEVRASFTFGCDGVHSTVRKYMIEEAHDQIQECEIESPIKVTSFRIPSLNQEDPLSPQLHVWEQEESCMVAIPNIRDHSFTANLFITKEKLGTIKAKPYDFISANFPFMRGCTDMEYIERRMEEFYPLYDVDFPPCEVYNTFVLGDAAHTAVPKYGEIMVMNEGLQNCLLFYKCLQSKSDLSSAINEYICQQKNVVPVQTYELDNLSEMESSGEDHTSESTSDSSSSLT